MTKNNNNANQKKSIKTMKIRRKKKENKKVAAKSLFPKTFLEPFANDQQKVPLIARIQKKRSCVHTTAVHAASFQRKASYRQTALLRRNAAAFGAKLGATNLISEMDVTPNSAKKRKIQPLFCLSLERFPTVYLKISFLPVQYIHDTSYMQN